MSEPCYVFISYRRKDSQGHARALHRDLCRRFDETRIFFDRRSIEAGEDFKARLSQAVLDCRAVLALIGPGWIDARDEAGRRRLEAPADYVRQEIDLALALKKRVIPVLFDDTPVPRATELPAPLQALSAQDALTLRGKDYEYDTQLEELVRLLGTIPGIPPPRAAEGARGRPLGELDKLPYLCDRSEQEAAVREALRRHLGATSRRPLVLVVHGRANEAHRSFVERLENVILPRILCGTSLTGHVRFLYLPRALPEGGDISRNLRDQIAEQLQEPDFDKDEVIFDYLRRLRLGGIAAVSTWRSSECARDPATALRRLLDYWGGFPDTNDRALVIGVFSLKYDSVELRSGPLGQLRRWLAGIPEHEAGARAALEALRREIADDSRFAFRVLPELRSVTLAQLDSWAQEAARLIGDLPESALQAIIPPDESLPMDHVLDRLQKLVAARSPTEVRRGATS